MSLVWQHGVRHDRHFKLMNPGASLFRVGAPILFGKLILFLFWMSPVSGLNFRGFLRVRLFWVGGRDKIVRSDWCAAGSSLACACGSNAAQHDFRSDCYAAGLPLAFAYDPNATLQDFLMLLHLSRMQSRSAWSE